MKKAKSVSTNSSTLNPMEENTMQKQNLQMDNATLHTYVQDFMSNPLINKAYLFDTDSTNAFSWFVLSDAEKVILEKYEFGCTIQEVPDSRLVTLAGSIRARAAFGCQPILHSVVMNRLQNAKVDYGYIKTQAENQTFQLVNKGAIQRSATAIRQARKELSDELIAQRKYEINQLRHAADDVFDCISGQYAENAVANRIAAAIPCRINDVVLNRINSYRKTMRMWVEAEYNTLINRLSSTASPSESKAITDLLDKACFILQALGANVDEIKQQGESLTALFNQLRATPLDRE